MKTILIGLGDIVSKHLEVLNEFNCEVVGVLTRNYDRALVKAKQFGIETVFRSINEISKEDCDFFTILVSPENNGKVLSEIIPLKKPILIEKPVSFSLREIDDIMELNKNYNTPIMVAMNRRFYSVFHKGLDYLKENGKKINSIVVEAPERFTDINKPKFNETVRKNWMFCNSIHCIDLIRFFGGNVSSNLVNSDKNRFLFNAIGQTENDIKFTYISNWKSPGSWSVSLYADDIKIIYNPLEKGKILEKGKEKDILPSPEDTKYKPGFYDQLKHFLKYIVENNSTIWPGSDLLDHRNSIKLVEEIYRTTK